MAIARLTRCTVPDPTFSSRAILRMPGHRQGSISAISGGHFRWGFLHRPIMSLTLSGARWRASCATAPLPVGDRSAQYRRVLIVCHWRSGRRLVMGKCSRYMDSIYFSAPEVCRGIFDRIDICPEPARPIFVYPRSARKDFSPLGHLDGRTLACRLIWHAPQTRRRWSDRSREHRHR